MEAVVAVASAVVARVAVARVAVAREAVERVAVARVAVARAAVVRGAPVAARASVASAAAASVVVSEQGNGRRAVEARDAERDVRAARVAGNEKVSAMKAAEAAKSKVEEAVARARLVTEAAVEAAVAGLEPSRKSSISLVHWKAVGKDWAKAAVKLAEVASVVPKAEARSATKALVRA